MIEIIVSVVSILAKRSCQSKHKEIPLGGMQMEKRFGIYIVKTHIWYVERLFWIIAGKVTLSGSILTSWSGSQRGLPENLLRAIVPSHSIF
jgi:hypothetical protein